VRRFIFFETSFRRFRIRISVRKNWPHSSKS